MYLSGVFFFLFFFCFFSKGKFLIENRIIFTLELFVYNMRKTVSANSTKIFFIFYLSVIAISIRYSSIFYKLFIIFTTFRDNFSNHFYYLLRKNRFFLIFIYILTKLYIFNFCILNREWARTFKFKCKINLLLFYIVGLSIKKLKRVLVMTLFER